MSDDKIVVHPSAAENGMATMLAELMRSNIEASSYKALCFKLLKATVAIEAADAEVQVTLVFNRGSCVIYDGIHGNVDVRVEADSETILQLSMVKIVAGLPFYLDETGFEVIGKTLRGELRMQGMVCHPLTLNLLTIVLSVN